MYFLYVALGPYLIVTPLRRGNCLIDVETQFVSVWDHDYKGEGVRLREISGSVMLAPTTANSCFVGSVRLWVLSVS